MEQHNKDILDVSEHVFFKSFQYFFSDLKKYAGFSVLILLTHSILLFMGSYLWVNYNGFYESQAFFDAYINTGFDIGYLFSHNLWWLSLKVHVIVSCVCLINAILCKFLLISNYYEIMHFLGRFVLWFFPNMLIAAIFIEDAYIFDYQTAFLICLMPGLFLTHPSMMLVRTIIPDLGDIHRIFLWWFYRKKTVAARM